MGSLTIREIDLLNILVEEYSVEPPTLAIDLGDKVVTFHLSKHNKMLWIFKLKQGGCGMQVFNPSYNSVFWLSYYNGFIGCISSSTHNPLESIVSCINTPIWYISINNIIICIVPRNTPTIQLIYSDKTSKVSIPLELLNTMVGTTYLR